MAKVKLVIPLLSQFWYADQIQINPRYLAHLSATGYSSLMERRIPPSFADPGDSGDLPVEPNRENKAKGPLLWKVPVPKEEM